MTGEPQGSKPDTDQQAEVPPERQETVPSQPTAPPLQDNENSAAQVASEDEAPAPEQEATVEAAPPEVAAPVRSQAASEQPAAPAVDPAPPAVELDSPPPSPIAPPQSAVEPEPAPEAAAPAPSPPTPAPSFAPHLPNPRPHIAPVVAPLREPAVAAAADAPAPRSLQRPLQPPPLPTEPQQTDETGAAAATPEPAHPLPGLPAAGAAEGPEDEEIVEFEPGALDEIVEDYGPEVAALHEGERREGTVVSVSEDGAVVDFGGKTEGFLSAKNANDQIDFSKLEPGAALQVVVSQIGEPGEYIKLALVREENTAAWAALEAAYQERAPVEATALERVKGGLSVAVAGLTAFLPGSQAALQGGVDLDSLIGSTFPVAVVKLSRKRGNVVVSRRELLEQEIKALRQETLAKLEVGAEAVGKVKNVTSYGAFIDLGGIDGLIHVTDISYGRIKDPAAVLEPGQQVTAKVVKLDAEKERVSLSLKAMEPDPWETVSERYQEGMVVKGAVASVTDYGAFVELEPGVEGLIHITEMTWSKRLRHPSKVVQEDQEVESVVLNVSPGERRISLSLKQRQRDPWEAAAEHYSRGAVVEGRVRNVTSYGAFVELEEGVDGLVHVSDLTWDTRVRNPKDVVQKGQTIQAVVLDIDSEKRRLSLGVKQLQPDAWETFFAEHGLGEILPGRVSRQAKFGYFVELAPGVEGLCHNSQIPHHGKSRKTLLETGSVYEFEIIKIDESDKRIGLRSVSLDALEQVPSE